MLKKRAFKVAVLLLALVFMASLAVGCGGGAGEEEEGDVGEKEVVKIAFFGPLTGPNAGQGVGARNAFLLAVDQANESGDLPFKLEVMVLDDESKPATSASVAQKAVADPDVVVGSGHWNTPCAEASVPIFKAEGLPFVIWGAIGPDLTSPENYPYVTRVAPTQAQENIPLTKFVVEELGRKKWALISDTSSYGKSNTDAFPKELEKYPDTEVVSLDEIQVGQTDFRPILSKIKNLDIDGVYYGGIVMEAALIRKQMVELGMKDTLLVGISGIVDQNFIETAGADDAEGVIGVTPGQEMRKLDGGIAFEEAYEAAGYSDPYGAYGPYAYDSANIIIEALKQVGPDPEKLVDAIVSITYSGLLGETSFDEVGQTTNPLATVLVVQDGEWIDFEDSKYKSGELKLPGSK